MEVRQRGAWPRFAFKRHINVDSHCCANHDTRFGFTEFARSFLRVR